MGSSDKEAPGNNAASARALLERYLYGHAPEVEAVLRFAHDHRLDEDNLVFLLVAILKVNETTVRLLLTSVADADRVIENARKMGKDLHALSQKLIAQQEAAAIRAAGHLNVAADRFSGLMVRANDLGDRLLVASGELQAARGVFEHAAGISEGRFALNSLIERIRAQAQADLRVYHSELIEELDLSVRRKVWAVHLYGLAALLGISLIIMIMVLE
ncbi:MULTISPECIES: hypothetical protein [unclassified Sphingomonas]|uniref:hypothetical protein n=1 Tax=unclassified Sphingomonas TaxID=196159 RepID=UPI00082BD473|nr:MULTISPECIES: hypothetical protein [unclassified Sphingomonas]